MQISLNVEKIELKLRHKVLPENSNLLPLKKPTNKEELELFLRNVDSYRICLGGPTLNYYRNTVLDCAIKDPPIYRHIDCTLVLSNNGKVCPKCLSLHARFGETIDKRFKKNLKNFMMTGQKRSQKIKKYQVENFKVKKDATPQTKKAIRGLKAKINLTQKKLTRREHIVSTLREDLEKLSNKMSNVTDNELQKLIEYQGLSKNEVIIKH